MWLHWMLDAGLIRCSSRGKFTIYQFFLNMASPKVLNKDLKYFFYNRTPLLKSCFQFATMYFDLIVQNKMYLNIIVKTCVKSMERNLVVLIPWSRLLGHTVYQKRNIVWTLLDIDIVDIILWYLYPGKFKIYIIYIAKCNLDHIFFFRNKTEMDIKSTVVFLQEYRWIFDFKVI